MEYEVSSDFFSKNYSQLKYPIQDLSDHSSRGFRLSQLGAIHSISAHFAVKSSPAIITMPTGTGKTGVLLAAPFILRSKRVLVIAPSALLRDQLYSSFLNLGLLRRIGALPDGSSTPQPAVYKQSKRIITESDWKKLESFDVVISTPYTISPGHFKIPHAPNSLFDLVMLDEGHHEPAKTWRAIVNEFESNVIICSATPFRRDGKVLSGKIIFHYSVKKAMEDGVYSKIDFVPVKGKFKEDTEADDARDIAIAKRVDECFLNEKSNNYKVLIRTDSQDDAERLIRIYKDNSSLRLGIIYSRNAGTTAERVLARMENGELDGVIAVNMLGEGIDLPSLKIAGLHAPYKSIAATLQFLGRFSRVQREDDIAKFVAVPSIQLYDEAEKLYSEEAIWSEVIPTLLSQKIDEKIKLEDNLESFQQIVHQRDEDLSLYAIWPFFHVRAYRCSESNLSEKIESTKNKEVLIQSFSRNLNTVVIVSRVFKEPLWLKGNVCSDIEHSFDILVHAKEKNILFICTSNKTESNYDMLIRYFTSGSCELIPFNLLRRVLRGLENPRFVNVGMKNIAYGSHTESYRMLSGRSSELGIRLGDERVYSLGHAFGFGEQGSQDITLGISSSSKIWSQKKGRVPSLANWCQNLADRIENDDRYNVNPYIDALGVPQKAMTCPDDIFAIDWNEQTYNSKAMLFINDRHFGLLFQAQITLSPDRGEKIVFTINSGSLELKLSYSPLGRHYFSAKNPNAKNARVETGNMIQDLTQYLDTAPPRFFSVSGGFYEGGGFLKPKQLVALNFPDKCVLTRDWSTVNIRNESKQDEAQKMGLDCIQTFTQKNFLDDAVFAINDDGKGELADIISISKKDRILVRLFHCKFSESEKAGARIKDLYEVCGQAVRSTRIGLRKYICDEIRKRMDQDQSTLLKGTMEDLERLEATPVPWLFQAIIVQPGISKKKALDNRATFGNIKDLLAATHSYLNGQNFQDLLLVCSP